LSGFKFVIASPCDWAEARESSFGQIPIQWPDTGAIGPEGWHYQLRATMAAAIDDVTRGMGGGLEPRSPPLPAATLHPAMVAPSYLDLEGEVLNLSRMARLAELQLHQCELECRDDIEVPDYEDTDLVIFAVSQVAIMAKKFEELDFRAFEGDPGKPLA
jgi:hypothetical protein